MKEVPSEVEETLRRRQRGAVGVWSDSWKEAGEATEELRRMSEAGEGRKKNRGGAEEVLGRSWATGAEEELKGS